MSDSAATPPSNPYIGARPFRRGEQIYGRARESRDLLSQLVGDRIVLLNSPSGAGKTSLIQASLVPRLLKRRFAVRPTIRVGAAAPLPGANRYLLSVMQSLEEARPAAEQLPPEDLAALTLDAYLTQRSSAGAEHGQVLIFDQFEEVLTLDPTDEAARLTFFEQLGDALADPWRWALFAIREEYVAALEVYAYLVPTRFANSFRLNLLGVEAAQEAIVGPAESRGVAFDPAAAETLASNLAQMVVQGADGRPAQRTGTSVEPVQLQVVCYRLWERRFAASAEAAGQQISAGDVEQIGSVDQALAEYYDSGVARASAGGPAGERAVRGWIDGQLITRQGFRSQVLQGAEAAFGLGEATIDGLTDAYLVREERRRGATWLELAHDRLIAPVRASNQRWFASNLSPLQRQAEIWLAQGQPDSLLFRDKELAAAELWAAAAELTKDEQGFLDRCREERRRAEERARQARRIRNLAIGAALAAVVAVIAAGAAFSAYGQAQANFQEAATQRSLADGNAQTAVANEARAVDQQATAEANARVSRSRELAAASLNRLNSDPELAVLLGARAVRATGPGDPAVREAADALSQAVNAARTEHTIVLSGTSAFDVAYSPDGASIAAAAADGTLRLWAIGQSAPAVEIAVSKVALRAVAYRPGAAEYATADAAGLITRWDARTNAQIDSTAVYSNVVRQLVYSPDGALLAVAGNNSAAWVLDASSLEPRYQPPVAAGARVLGVAFSPDGALLAGANNDDTATVWRLADGALLKTFRHPANAFGVFGVAFSPDGALLVTSDGGGVIRLWDLNEAAAESAVPRSQLLGHTNTVVRLAFSPNGALLASNSADGQIRLWNVRTERNVLTLAGHSNIVRAVSFSPDSQRLVSSSTDGTIRFWRLNLLQGSDGYALAYSPDGATLASGDDEGLVRLWDSASGALRGTLRGHTKAIRQLAFSPDGATLLSASLDGSVRLWRADGAPLRTLGGDTAEVEIYSASFSPDGGQVAAGGTGGAIWVWDAASGRRITTITNQTDVTPAIVKAVVFGQNGQELISGDNGGAIRFWGLPDGGELRPAISYPSEITHMDRSSDGSRVAVSGFSPTPISFDLADPSRQTEFAGHSNSVSQLIFSADGRRLASVSDDKTIRVWNAADPRLPQVIGLPDTANPYAVSFNPQGTALAVTGSDGLVRLIPLGLDDLLALATQRTSRALTSLECQKYYLTEGCSP